MQPHRLLPEIESSALVLANEDYRAELRLKCQTDLFFLARVLGYDKIIERVHRAPIELRVKKNPALPIEEQCAIKKVMHFDPRGSFKSTIGILDSVQWIICFPNVRICKVTATKPLAQAIAGEITDHFIRAANADEPPTIFQALFPEFMIGARDKRVGEYTAPCRTQQWREATVMAFSIETSITGWHFDVFDPDDVVDTINSASPQGIEKVKRNYHINIKTLMPWGYIHVAGTRYNPFDLYGEMIEAAEPGKVKMLVRGAMKTRDGRRLEQGEFPAPEDVEILFPELLSYDYLKEQFPQYESFMTQYMNDAHGGNEVVFPIEALHAATVPAEQVPVSGQAHMAWRFPCESKGMAKSAGAAGILENGRMCIVDVARGTFTPSGMAHKIVLMAKKWGCNVVRVEETPGARYLESAILNYSLTMNWPLRVQWVEFQEDDGARRLRMAGAEPLLLAMRLNFSAAIVNLKELFRQFANFGMIEDNELPDVVSRLTESLPKLIAVPEEGDHQDLQWEMARARDMYDRTHGIGKYAPAEPIEKEAYKPPESDVAREFGLPDVLGGLNG